MDVRAKENGNHLFIHLNLCIALALGLVVFIAGIENATSNEVAMFHYYYAVYYAHCLDCLQVCSSTLTVFIHISFLLDVV